MGYSPKRVLPIAGSDTALSFLPFQPITSGYPSAGAGSYTMRTGDTLQTIAQAAYGDSQLWYLIADANGLNSNADLRVGQTVSIPTKVGSIHNTSGTYKPYDPSQIIGSTTPTLPVPQSDGGDDCGGFGQIIMIIVAVAVTVISVGTLGPVAAAALGSIASQVVGNALGIVDGFSWKAVALAALSAGVTEGLPAGDLLGTTGGTANRGQVFHCHI